MEHFKCKVDDRSIKVGGEQSIRTLEGYVAPLSFREGLTYIAIRPYTNEEYRDLPHVVMTSDEVWDPTKMDDERDHKAWLQTQADDTGEFTFALFNAVGEYVGQRELGELCNI